jgi:hypothetical protein
MKTVTVLFGAALSICGALNAQTLNDRMSVKFPDPVMINGAILPAGNATIQVIHNSGALILAVRSEAGPYSSVLVNRLSDTPDENAPKVIMDVKNGNYRLNRILLPDNTALQILDPR